jgi:hypothetical protein
MCYPRLFPSRDRFRASFVGGLKILKEIFVQHLVHERNSDLTGRAIH